MKTTSTYLCFDLLKDLIEKESFSKEEWNTSLTLEKYFNHVSIPFERIENNIWAKNKYFDTNKKNILLNSHIDTVKPATGYTKNPFQAIEEDGKIYGLGSNDAGGALCALWETFCYFYNDENLPFNLIFLASAEEEISGKNGVELALKHLPIINFGIVGEPTSMEMAIAEKGLLVIDALVKGKSGHAARNEGENAIYLALKDLNKIQQFQFDKISPVLGETKITCTVINAGSTHNVVPDECRYTLDIRTNECYSHQEIIEILSKELIAELTPRSVRLQSSGIGLDHPIIRLAEELGIKTYGSPTLSDQSLMNFPTIKLGPGDSARSHTADEFIYKWQIEEGVEVYKRVMEGLKLVNSF